jgi:predicted ATPase/DNA-binding SARP family transcriptional activator
VSLTRLVGRERELGALQALVASQRLVTLTGVGGAGKTRLAAELALRLDWQRADSVVWVELAPCTDPLLVVQQVAAGVSLREPANVGVVADALRDRDLLLVLDNCEHVVAACAELAGALLTECPRLHVLATSREPLGVAGERVWPVPPLSIETEAVELFVDRAMAVDPRFALTDDNTPAVLEICRRLDGIPLAIELAAARIRVLTPEQIRARLEDRFAILTGGARTTVPRHRTLRAAIDWSFTLLGEREQTLLARLSVFAGTFSLEAAEAVCGADVLDLLSGLVDKSLVVSAKRKETVRYYLLDSIREYAAERLDDADAWRMKHAQAFLELARVAEPELVTAVAARVDSLEPEHDNLRAALTWSLEREPETLALPLAAATRWYWYYRILWSEGLRWMERVLERVPPGETAEYAAVLSAAGTFCFYRGEAATARPQLEEAEAIWRTLGDERQLSLCLAVLAQLLASAGELETAAAHANECVSLARKSGTPWELGYCLANAAGFVEQRRGRLDDADRALAEAEALWAPTRHKLGYPFVLSTRALLAVRRGDHSTATRLARTALAETRERRYLWFSARALRVLAYTSSGDPHRAARLLGAADGMMSSISTNMLPHELAEYERLLASLSEAMPPDELEAVLQDGRRMSFDEACELALAPRTESAIPSLYVADLGPLQITFGGNPVVAEGRASGRARELLAFLAAHPDGRTKEEVGVAFWPDATTEQVKNSFHVTLHRLRKLLGSPDSVTADGARYLLNVQHAVESRRFETAMTAALRSGDIPSLEAALALYRGDYLQGEDAGEWCLPIRAQLRQFHLRGLFALGQAQEARGRYTDAAETYTRVLAREPFHEAACRQLMICRARLGARSESLLLYRQLEQRLRDDLQAAPERETSALYQRLRQNEAV